MKNKKDILLLCQFFYPEYVSSAALPYDTAIAFSENGFSVGVLCGYPKEYSLGKNILRKEIHKNINIKRLKYIQLKRSNFIGRIVNNLSFTLAVALNIAHFRNYKTVLVYSDPPILPIISVIADRLFKMKIIFICYDVYPEIALATNSISQTGIIRKMMKVANKMIFKRVEKVVALSSEMKNYLLKNRMCLIDSQINIIPNWFENKDITSIKFKKTIFRDFKRQEELVVSYFGNMGTCQDIDTIIKAIRQLKDNSKIKFLFAGHGNKMANLKEIVKEEKLENVKIFDFLHGQDFEEALKVSDCFLISLVDRLTGLCVPSKTYSYMMAGKPIIAIIGKNSDVAKDLEQNNCGYVMEVGEYSKLVSFIKELYKDSNKRKLMGENCRKVFLQKYTKEQCTQQYVDMMKKILEV